MKLSSLSRMGFSEVKSIFYILLSYVLARFVHEDNLWLVCERGTDARDNGLWMYRYIKQNHPEVNVKFIITSSSEDRKRIEQIHHDCHSESEIIETNSFRHHLLMWKSKYMLSTHLLGCLPYFEDHPGLKMWVVNRIPATKMVWLQHGVIKDDLKIAYYGLHDFRVKKKQILLMPTWRRWLNAENFQASEFFQKYVSLLNNETLERLLEENDMNIVFYPHHEIQPYLRAFRKNIKSSRIIIADKRIYDVQQLLKESALLVTDYSSVLFDFAYMYKPILFYQFDQAQCWTHHYSKGYFQSNWLGYVAKCEDELVETLAHVIEKKMKLDAEVANKILDFFPLHDTSNCERIFKEIIKL